eukprot:scaffold127737_cov115-Phaeocystis_antarctica.AAC.2
MGASQLHIRLHSLDQHDGRPSSPRAKLIHVTVDAIVEQLLHKHNQPVQRVCALHCDTPVPWAVEFPVCVLRGSSAEAYDQRFATFADVGHLGLQAFPPSTPSAAAANHSTCSEWRGCMSPVESSGPVSKTHSEQRAQLGCCATQLSRRMRSRRPSAAVPGSQHLGSSLGGREN